ncbi:hypothetical protein FBY40_3279 [Microbacterium sp. SLBN-154]|uniref:hypothetical protein n=1 Tax=Microbacterium sp. SLBN-154 TaxID=2768458 RepID=UPI00114EFB76|nr:hypothetical protein [Microbacterium sp. SLBN-154]TQK20736.1 hypothetical protein FBY40_3279 [Microbacterium sp. SLBN-154]
MAAHDIPDTPEIRATLQRSQEEGLAALGLKSDTVEPWEDGYRAAAAADSTFEWWYFDCQFDDGSTLVVTFSNKPHTDPSGPLTPTLLVIRQLPDGTRRHLEPTFPAGEFAAATDSCDVRIGPSRVTGDLRTYDLHIEADDIVADVHIDRAAPSWRPGAGITYFGQAKDRYLAWVVPVPYGTATATVTEHGTTRQLTGSAYHDHNWGNHLMGSFLDHWYWGRAHVGDYTLVYVRMTTKGLFGFGEVNIPTFFLAKGDRLITDDLVPLRLTTSGDVPGPGHQSYPTRMEWTWRSDRGSIAMTVTNPTLIESLDMKVPRHGVGALLHAGEHPMYYDFNADVDLDIRLDDLTDHVTGRTLYEKMMFR